MEYSEQNKIFCYSSEQNPSTFIANGFVVFYADTLKGTSGGLRRVTSFVVKQPCANTEHSNKLLLSYYNFDIRRYACNAGLVYLNF